MKGISRQTSKGGALLEFAIIAPFIIALILFMVGGGCAINQIFWFYQSLSQVSAIGQESLPEERQERMNTASNVLRRLFSQNYGYKLAVWQDSGTPAKPISFLERTLPATTSVTYLTSQFPVQISYLPRGSIGNTTAVGTGVVLVNSSKIEPFWQNFLNPTSQYTCSGAVGISASCASCSSDSTCSPPTVIN